MESQEDGFVTREILNRFDQPREKLGNYISRLLSTELDEHSRSIMTDF